MIFNLYNNIDVQLVKKALEGKSSGLTSGAYDLLHPKHESYLTRCRRHCGHDGILVVGVDSDALVKKRKGPTRPSVCESERLQMVENSKSVDAAFILDSAEDFGRAAELLGVRFIFKNQEYEGPQIKVFGADIPGVELVIIPDFENTQSTTQLIRRIQSLSNTQS